MFIKHLIKLLILIQIGGDYVWAADSIPIAIINQQNLTGDTNLIHWQSTISALLEFQLRMEKKIRIMPESSIDFGLHELQLQPDEGLRTDQARELGKVIEARQIIWGGYQIKKGKWDLSMGMVNVRTGKASKKLAASSADLFQAISKIRSDILFQLGIKPTEEEISEMNRTPTILIGALDWWGRARAANRENKPLFEVAADLRQAISIDPQFVMAQQGLAYVLFMQGNINEALVLAKQAVTNCPDYAEAHSTLGTIFYSENLMDLAEGEFLEAIRLNPGYAQAYSQLVQIYFQRNELNQGVAFLKKAEEFNPYDPSIHALLGYFYPYLYDSKMAISELNMAENYNIDGNVGIENTLAQTYERLHEVPRAVEHYEKYIAAAKATGLNSSFFEHDETQLEYLKASLTNNFIIALKPQLFTTAEINRFLEENLTPEECRLVINPFIVTSKVDQWADLLAGDTQDELGKAKRLFDGLTRHVDINLGIGTRTAMEAFKDWSNPRAGITCQDYTFLYVAMARHLGLQAYYVLVTRDYSGRHVSHACAGVFIDGKALLIDPAYVWFGIPHQEYEFENDLRVAGLYACESSDDATINTGLKLVPDWAWPHFLVAVKQCYKGQLNEAKETLRAGLVHDSASWMSLYTQAELELADKNWDAGIGHLQGCLALDPDFPNIHFALGRALQEQGKFIEARTEFRVYLQQSDFPQFADVAREAIESINESPSIAPQTSR